MANGNGGGGDNDFKAVRAASVAEASQAADKKRIEDMLREPEGRADLTPDTRLDRWPNKGIHPVGLLVSLCRQSPSCEREQVEEWPTHDEPEPRLDRRKK